MAYLDPSAHTNFSSNLHVLGRKLQITSADRLASVYLTTACLPAVHASTHSLTQSSEPSWGSIRHRQTSSIQTGPGPATAARSTSFQLFLSRPRWSSAKCRVVYPGASSHGAPKTAPRAGAGLSSCKGHGQATSTVFFSPPERC